MNKKGIENIGIGGIIIVAVAILVGLVILQQSATNVAVLTNEVTNINQTIAFPSNVTTSFTALSGQAARNVIVTNATNGAIVASANYTIQNYVVNTQGALEARIRGNSVPGDRYNGQNVNITYTYEPYGYDTNGGGRAIAGLIIIFFAIGIAITALVLILKNSVFDLGYG